MHTHWKTRNNFIYAKKKFWISNFHSTQFYWIDFLIATKHTKLFNFLILFIRFTVAIRFTSFSMWFPWHIFFYFHSIGKSPKKKISLNFIFCFNHFRNYIHTKIVLNSNEQFTNDFEAIHFCARKNSSRVVAKDKSTDQTNVRITIEACCNWVWSTLMP